MDKETVTLAAAIIAALSSFLILNFRIPSDRSAEINAATPAANCLCVITGNTDPFSGSANPVVHKNIGKVIGVTCNQIKGNCR